MPTGYMTEQDIKALFLENMQVGSSSTSWRMNTVSDCIDNTTSEVEKLIKLLYQSIGVNPYDEYGNLRPDEDILSDLIAANLKINISIDDIIGG